jgi:hypothetical protein
MHLLISYINVVKIEGYGLYIDTKTENAAPKL